MAKKMTHTVVIEDRQGGFQADMIEKVVKCRLLKHHIVLEHNTKYKKDDGLMVGAHRYRGIYMESTKVKPKTLKEINIQEEK